MGRAFNRLQKQVVGRRPDASGYVTTSERLLNVETALLELLAYQVGKLAAQGEDPKADALVAASNDFKRTLERVLGA